MSLRVFTVPYEARYQSVRMGRGPEYLIENGPLDALKAIDTEVEVRAVEPETSFKADVSTAFELDRLISNEVYSGVVEGEFPLVFSGNCNNSLGTVTGVSRAAGMDVGIVWLDGHADFHTPETTTSGFTDCMVLSILVGHCWESMSARVLI